MVLEEVLIGRENDFFFWLIIATKRIDENVRNIVSSHCFYCNMFALQLIEGDTDS